MKLSKKQNDIVVAALKLISKGGLQHLTIKTLSGSLNITEGAIYRHFSSKQEILNAIADTFDDRYLKINEKLFNSEKDAVEKIKDIFFEKIHRLSEHPEQTAIIISNNLFRKQSSFCDQVDNILESYRKSIYKIIADGQKTGNIRKDLPKEHIYDILLGSMHMFFTRWERSMYSYDLKIKGKELWNSLHKVISNSQANITTI